MPVSPPATIEAEGEGWGDENVLPESVMSEPLTVILLNTTASIGGVAVRLNRIGGRLRRRGHDARMWFLNPGPLLESGESLEHLHVGPLAELARTVAAGGVDIVHGPVGLLRAGAGCLHSAGRAKVLPMVVGAALPGWGSWNCAGLVAVSRSSAEMQQRVTDLPVQVVLNGVDPDRFSPVEVAAEPQPIIGWVGRAGDLVQKRPDLLAAAAPALVRAGCRLEIASPQGPGQTAPRVAEVLRPLAARWSSVPPEQMPEFYSRVAASGGYLLSTAEFEGLPMALLEAQMCGCPVIARDVIGNNECVLPEHGGVLFPADLTGEAIAEVVLTALADRDLQARRREACRAEMLRGFTLDAMVDGYLDLYRSLPHRPIAASATWRCRAQEVAYALGSQKRREAARNLHRAALELAAGGSTGLAWRLERCAGRTSPRLFWRGQPRAERAALRRAARNGG